MRPAFQRITIAASATLLLVAFQNCGKSGFQAINSTSTLSSTLGTTNPSPTPKPGTTPTPVPTATPIGMTPTPVPTATPIGMTPTPTPVSTPVACTDNSTTAVAPTQRLTKQEYNNVIRDLFGITKDYASSFTADAAGPSGFFTESTAQSITPDMVNNFWTAAKAVTTDVFKLSSNPFITCGTKDEACARSSITAFGAKMFRRPLTTDEVDRLITVYRASSSSVFTDAMQVVMQAMLMSPQFIFRSYDLPSAQASVVGLTSYELASRISFFIWGSIPDDSLRAAAANGTIKDPAVMETQVRRMLADTRSRYLQTTFGRQWLDLDRFDGVNLETSRYPDWNATLKADMKSEADYLLDSIFYGNQSVYNLVGGKFSYLNANLATHYKIAGVSGAGFTKVSNPNANGVLTLGSVIAMNSKGVVSSPVRRGKYVLARLLCADPGPPPNNVTPLPVASGAGKVYDESQIREQMDAHVSAVSCMACHKTMDPIGYTFESYDSSGAFRTNYTNGVRVDSSGQLPTGENMNGVGDLANILQSDVRFRRCFVSKMSTFAQGRDATLYPEQCANQNLANASVGANFKFADAVVAIVKSKNFVNRTVAY